MCACEFAWTDERGDRIPDRSALRESAINQGDSSSNDEGDIETKLPTVGFLGSQPSSSPTDKKKMQEYGASTSRNSLKSHFVGMGFPSALVDQAVEENGSENAELLLEMLFTYSASGKSHSEIVNCPSEATILLKEELENSNICQDSEDKHAKLTYYADKSASLLKMNFPVEVIELAIDRLGVQTPLAELIDFILAAQMTERSGSKDPEKLSDDEETKIEEITSDGLFETMDKTLRLLEMGFSEDEVSSAIANFGSDIPVLELADSIFANRISQSKEDDMKELGQFPIKQDFSYVKREDCSDDENGIGCIGPAWPECHAGKTHRMTDEGPSSSVFVPKNAVGLKNKGKRKLEKIMSVDSQQILGSRTREAMIHSKVPVFSKPKLCRQIHDFESSLTYFFYGNVVDISQSGWEKISRFLYGMEPEFADSQYFSAYSRKEGYIHNLPTGNRSRILPLSPMTIQEALPNTKKWWPSWDTRSKLSCISSDTKVAQLCERLGKIVVDSQGMPSYEQRKDILHHCKTLNLVWTGPCRLTFIGPEEVELILGYPKFHTDVHFFSPTERLASLKNSFQTDTLGYHLSVLGEIFPQGVNVLSLYSGIGGAEVSLHRLGIRLRCVVSVESSELHRAVLRNWWNRSAQTGELIEIEGIHKLTSQRMVALIETFGSFNVVIGRNPGSLLSGRNNISVDAVEEFEFPLFFEFVRVLNSVRNIMQRT